MMRFSIRGFWTLGLGLSVYLGGAVSAATAQAPAAQPAPATQTTPQQPTLQERNGPPPGATVLNTGTQLVLVDVTVRDKHGNPVHGIKREDFTISEAKQPQKLRAFDEFATEATPPVLPPAPKLPAGSFTNYMPVPAKGPLNVLLIDALNTPLADQGYLISQMQQYMKRLVPGTRLAVFGLAGHLYFIQGFTSDPKAMQAAFASIKNGKMTPLLPDSNTDANALTDSLTDPGSTATNTTSSSAIMTGSISMLLDAMTTSQTSNRVTQTIEALITLGKWLEGFPGRKNVIWFSAAFPLGVDPNVSWANSTDIPGVDSNEYQLMVNTLTQAQVSVYPVDPRGLQSNTAFQASDVRPNQMGNFAGNSASFNANKDAEHSTMQAIASDTGGVPFYNGNDLGKAVDNAINDGANYYTLAYSPSEHKTGGEWRSIQVALNGDLAKAGYTLSYRRGYFAENTKHADYKTGAGTVSTVNFTPQREAHNYARESMTRGAPMPTDILFTARVLPHSARPEDTLVAGNVQDPKTPMAPPYRRFDVDVAAMPKYFTLTKQANGNYIGAIELAVFVYSVDGKLINTAAKKLSVNLTQEAYEKFEKNYVGVHLEVSAPAEKDSVLRIGFQDVPSNHIGALEVATASVKNLPPQN
jgi:VWFA-related protein